MNNQSSVDNVMNENATISDDEIDLSELFVSLASSWRLIASTALVSVALSYGYANYSADPTYEAKAEFAFMMAGGNAGLGAEAFILGMNTAQSIGNNNVFDRVESRDFVTELAEEAGHYEDPYFKPRLDISGPAEPISYNEIDAMTEWSDAEVEQAIVERFQETVDIAYTKHGSIEVTVTHRDPQAAAFIANAVVKKILDDTLDLQMSKSTREVDYLGEQLSKAQSEMDDAVMQLQEFAISRNALSLENLVQSSSELVTLRETRDATRRMYDGVIAMIAAPIETAGRSAVLQSYPELLSSEFRIQAQMSGDDLPLSDLPTARLEQISSSLSARLQGMDAAISASSASAKISADEASELLALQRDVKAQEANYQVLKELYKTKYVMNEFAESSGTMLQFAVPPLEPTGTKSGLILALGAVLGVFAGAGIALARGLMSGRLHTARAIATAVRADKVFQMKHNSLPSEIVANLAGTSRYLLMWQLSSSSKKVSETAVRHILKAWSDAGLTSGILSLPPEGSAAETASASRIDLGDVMGHLLRGNLRDALEAKTSHLDRVLVICDFGKVPSSLLTAAKTLPLTIVAVASPGDVVKSSTDNLCFAAVPDVLLLG
jgi:uncharacterized protein involved in exopolysaccharide biosynthesis